MRIKDVVTLKKVVSDLNDGKAFYDRKETAVCDYFWDSLIADIESLRIYAGIHNIEKWALERSVDHYPVVIPKAGAGFLICRKRFQQ